VGLANHSVIARSEATKQSNVATTMDRFASLAMTERVARLFRVEAPDRRSVAARRIASGELVCPCVL
jgi:hypothetical protein